MPNGSLLTFSTGLLYALYCRTQEGYYSDSKFKTQIITPTRLHKQGFPSFVSYLPEWKIMLLLPEVAALVALERCDAPRRSRSEMAPHPLFAITRSISRVGFKGIAPLALTALRMEWHNRHSRRPGMTPNNSNDPAYASIA